MNRKRWTVQEEDRLLRQLKAFPANKRECFRVVSEELNRSIDAVALHWYTRTCKDPYSACFLSYSANASERLKKPINRASLLKTLKNFINRLIHDKR